MAKVENCKVFESRFKQYLGRKHTVGLSNCTEALFLSLCSFADVLRTC